MTGYSQPYGAGRGFGVNVGDQRFSMFGNTREMFRQAKTGIDSGDDGYGSSASGGNTMAAQERRFQTGTYGFRRFYEGRNELSGINSSFNWRDMSRPGVEPGEGPLFGQSNRSPKPGMASPKDWGPPQESHDISGMGPTRPMDKPPLGLGAGAVAEPDRSHNLYNARTRGSSTVGSTVARAGAASPGQQFAGYSGGTWPAGQIGSQPAIGSGQTSLRPAYPSAIDTSSST